MSTEATIENETETIDLAGLSLNSLIDEPTIPPPAEWTVKDPKACQIDRAVGRILDGLLEGGLTYREAHGKLRTLIFSARLMPASELLREALDRGLPRSPAAIGLKHILLDRFTPDPGSIPSEAREAGFSSASVYAAIEKLERTFRISRQA